MHAAKHFDPQLGLDIHLYVFPPLPVPIPLPTPHLGIVLDPFDYIPIIGGTVHVNGVKRATAGTGGLDVHIPLGPWMPTMRMPMGPQWDDEIFMGSMTVVADGDPLSRIAMPVLDCNIVGLVNPFRLRKPKKPQLSLSLPTAVNLAIPNHVNVGGPPMISIMGMAFKGLFAGLGRLRKLKAVQRALDGAKGKWSKLFSNMEPGFLKCKVLRAEPVDIRTGAVSVTHEDFSIPGRLPLAWTRRYRSDAIDQEGVCGWGWTTPADIRLEVGEDGVVFHPLRGPPAVYERLPLPGEGLVDPIDGARLTRMKAAQGDELHLRTKDDVVHVFTAPPANLVPLPGQPARHLRIERLEDRCGNAWTFERDGEHLVRIAERGLDTSPGRFIEVGAQGGRIHTMALHDPISGTTFPLVRYRHDAQGDLVAALDALDAARTFDYRGHRMVRHTDRIGLSFHYAYDERARVVHSWGDGGLYDYHFAYHDEIHETEVTDSLGHTSLVKLDADGLPLCEIDPLGGCTFFEYDEWGRTTGVTDPNGLRTGFAYDERGNLVVLTRADGGSTRTTYDDDDKPVVIEDANGATWRQAWDARGLLVMHATPAGHMTRYEHDARGCLVRHVNARGAVTRLHFDPHGHVQSSTNPLQQVSRFMHDAMGHIRTRIDPLGRQLHFHFDAKGRLLRVDKPGQAQIHCAYDAEDQLVRYVDENDAVTSLEYVGIGRLARRIQPNGQAVSYHHDTEERLVAVVNQRGETYTLTRDALGRVIAETDYWGQTRTYDYDAGGRLRRMVDPLSREIRYVTDALGRITRKSFADPQAPNGAESETFKYDRLGHLIEMRNASSHVVRRFDPEGRMVEEIQNGFKVRNAFDQVGNRVMRHSDAGHVVSFEFNESDRCTRVLIDGSVPISIERNSVGQPVLERLGQRLRRTTTYTESGQVMRQQFLRDDRCLLDSQFRYDQAGNLTSRTDAQRGTDIYSHDRLGRVLAHTNPLQHVQKFSHDPAGDRLATRVRETVAKMAVGGDALAPEWTREGDLDGRRYNFDRAGNLVSRAEVSGPDRSSLVMQWDANQRMTQSRWHGTQRGDLATSYSYDPLGRRVAKRTGTSTTLYFWDSDTLLGEVEHVDGFDGIDPSVRQDNVVSIVAARRRAASLRKAYGGAREYVYRPGGFEPLAMIDGERRVPPGSQRHTAEVLTDSSKSLFTPGVLGQGQPLGLQPPSTNMSDDATSGLGGHPATTDRPMPALGQGLTLGGSQAAAPSGSAAVHPAGKDDVDQAGHSGPTVYFYQLDTNGCPTHLADVAGQVVWAASYDAWGGVSQVHVERVRQPLRLQGQQFDLETGLHYNRHRYYEPRTGTFISQDPLRLIPGVGLYNWGPNTSAWVDAYGLSSEQLRKALGMVVGDEHQAHHLIPEELMSRYDDMFQHAETMGFLRDGASNGIPLPGNKAMAQATGLPGHWSNHNAYTSLVDGNLGPMYRDWSAGRLSDTQLVLGLSDLQSRMRSRIESLKVALKGCRLG